ncbi:WD40-repeat-containing domain protein [Phakopsora pachyrhizi]|uniref:WD40-repeat-containing domain protein n=1 Tax=Phakopsora pachyrhizi TaxID=170000 RepID=A0AAV0B1V3_PHAPC|nr:WD40-repeat-containing domain protein [Phakopsora pachyrhizi]CAH7677265.1 WD40-repeat-containing domain protein [Phakopsora pachyrhizi]
MTSGQSASNTNSSKVLLSPEVMSSLKMAKIFRTHNSSGLPFTSLCFDDRGENLITTAEDETLQLFGARNGKHLKQAFSKKYGCCLARFTHKSSSVIHASTKNDDTIRYLSLHDNTYIRYFKGHKRRVVSLEMSPRDDTFLSGASDDTVRLWDLRSPSCQGVLNIAGQPCVAYDPSGMVFAIALNMKQTILLYDLREFDSEPFIARHIEDPVLSRVSYPPPPPHIFTSLKFSNDGSKLLVGTAGDTHYVLDAFNGDVLARLEGHQGLGCVNPDQPAFPGQSASSQETSWTPDSRYVLSGSADGRILVWDVQPPKDDPTHAMRAPQSPHATWEPLKSYDGHQVGNPSRCVAFNPKLGMLATAGNEMVFWLPGGPPDGTESESDDTDMRAP